MAKVRAFGIELRCPTFRASRRIWLVLLLIAFVASACSAGKAPLALKGSSSRNTSGTSTSTTTTTTQPSAEAVNAWWTSFGANAVTKLRSDLGPFVEFVQTASTLAQYCPPLQTEVTSLLQGPPIPGSQAEADWKTALNDFLQGSTDCATGGQQNNQVLMTRGGQELYKGISEFSTIDLDLQNQNTPLSLETDLCSSAGVLVSVCTPAS